MKYRDTDERCHPEHMKPGDLQDHLERYRFASRFVAGKRVLDIACGTGYGSALLRKAGARSVFGVDLSESALEEAIRLYGPDYRVGSIIDFAEGAPYDVIVSYETIEHVADYEAALANLHRILAPAGTLLLSTPHRPVNSPHLQSLDDTPSNPFHVREFSVDEIVAAVERAGFKAPTVYGQKLRRPFKNGLASAAYAALAYARILPGHYSSSVLPLRNGLEPRYAVLKCRA